MQDRRDTWRALRATPVVTLVAVLSLGLGIGANTAIFSILDSLLLRSLPVREPERLTLMNRMTPEGVAIGWWTNPIWYGFWQRRFGGAADVIGTSMTIDRVPFTIVGVAPPEFFGADVGRTFDAAIPLGTEPLIRGRESGLDRRSTWWLNVMVRRRPDQPLEAAAATLRGLQPQIRAATLPREG